MATRNKTHASTAAVVRRQREIQAQTDLKGAKQQARKPVSKKAGSNKSGKLAAMGRSAQPEETAPAYVFLASPSCSSYISGAVLPVMGGPTS